MAKFTTSCQDTLERLVHDVVRVVKKFDDIQFDAAQKSQPMSVSKVKTVDKLPMDHEHITQGKEQEIMARLDALAEQVGKQTKMLEKLMEQRSLTSDGTMEDFFRVSGTGEEEAQEGDHVSVGSTL